MDTAEKNFQALGEKRERGDGVVKVTGQAKYAVEYQPENVAYGVVIQSTVASGRITRMETEKARQAPGVLAVYTHLNSLKINKPTGIADGGAAQSTYTPIQDDKIIHNGQNIGLVVAETFEQATWAASLVETEYETEPALIYPDDPRAERKENSSTNIDLGDAHQAMAQAEVRINARYATPREYNTPMEPHACIASWQDDRMTVWEPSQWVMGAQKEIAEWLGIAVSQVRIISPYVGGGFGSKPVPYTHVALACVASRALGRPIKVSLTRPQTFTGLGGRPATIQNLEMGASRDGKILAIIHDGLSDTSMIDTFAEGTNKATGRLYAVPNVYSRHYVAAINTVTPGWMRAPGENPSTYGLEVAMDEMAYELGIDPLAFRLRNWADHDYQLNAPWSTRRLKEAYAAAAEAFGWDKRSMAPRSMREGRELIGWGMATATYPVSRSPAEAKLIFHSDGSLVVQSAGADIGTGTYTILAQTAAEVLQIPSRQIRVELGDTDLPRAGVAGGSQLAGNLTAAVHKTAEAMREKLFTLATESPGSPLFQVEREQLVLRDGAVRVKSQPERAVSYDKLVKLNDSLTLSVLSGTFSPDESEEDRDQAVHSMSKMTRPEAFSAHSWGAQFVEVRVDEDFGTVRVKRLVSAFDSGRLYNPQLARSQWIGGMVMGLGQALLEGGVIDPRNARVINNNLADYLIAVNADVPEIVAIDVGEPDYHATLMGGKAVGELGIVGMAAAISNAVYHATGKRVRDLPLSLDKLID
ncbi:MULTISPECIES: xanthine dehydrogenase family protein molybdopterin-binding subunit [Pantoea]|jgi:xanthine dehydrogenase YagR molybdenum-binding subunit|nr:MULTISPECIES: xanthine dehydrogenase family protein molybdopterin-binding subunit [Pantoea]MDU6431432.1 xanthine dehydrogenase family protein molybdopterin-binding subunit [Pantoea sp.]MBZ6384406.1 xanthine dehydrogenase family protein molybdopterin-binding subunit [Pantoea piersonii]MBZ6399011.1 xanthine dehydrogenase family protein molybdopterin-binding subunit [Pantoea piersonii]MBZ6406333.1 xanthine dehydrogenase family protein molybdopterin-binding subunit [Pantoea piersonii]MBZ6425079